MRNWKQLCDKYHILYVQYGQHKANVKKGNINIKCPFCGQDDPSEHMGLNLSSWKWGCWRSAAHRGKNPYRLVIKLLNCTYEEAISIVSDKSYSTDGFNNLDINKLFTKDNIIDEGKVDFIKINPLFREIGKRKIVEKYKDYLFLRGFHKNEIFDLSKYYDIRGSLESGGIWFNRIIFSYYDKKGKLSTWSGRSIINEVPKYRANKKYITKTTDMLYNVNKIYENITVCDVLVLVEGPLDCIKIDWYGVEYGVRSVALSTVDLSDNQITQLIDIQKKVNAIVFIPDESAHIKALNTKLKLDNIIDLKIQTLPDNVSDPGDLSSKQAVELVKFIRGYHAV